MTVLIAACIGCQSSGSDATDDDDTLNYTVNTSNKQQKFDGWGVSLCWWANMAGNWSDKAIDQLVDWLVSPEELNYRFFRYNIGGGDDPANAHCDPHHMGRGKGLRAEMEGFKAYPGAQYDWSRDEAQRKIMLKIKEKRPDAVFEAFSNSAPWWMTVSGCVGGHASAETDNLKRESYEDFANYLVDVCKHYKDAYGIEFKTLEPFNEPMTNYWYRNGSQEGCHFDVASMIDFVRVLHPVLKNSGLKTGISVADETDVWQSVMDFEAFRDAGILPLISQFNTHTYEADDTSRARLRQLCSEAGIPLWQSETGSGGRDIAGNLSMAQRLISDLKVLAPSAWMDWQFLEEDNDQWCLVRAEGFEENNCRKLKNYHIRAQFSRFIKEGYTILDTVCPDVVAAISPSDDRLVLVAVNNSRTPLQHCAKIMTNCGNPRVQGYLTDSTRDLSPVRDVIFDDSSLRFTLPPRSIATFVMDF